MAAFIMAMHPNRAGLLSVIMELNPPIAIGPLFVVTLQWSIMLSGVSAVVRPQTWFNSWTFFRTIADTLRLN